MIRASFVFCLVIPLAAFADFTRTTEFGNDESSNVIAWGDYNNDGYPDLAVGNSSPETTNRLYTNNGGASFSETSPFGSGDTFALSWGDIENNGDLDLVVGNQGSANYLYVNTGSPLYEFTGMARFNSSGFPYTMSWADYDLDGDVDVAAGNILNNQNYLYENIGGYGFNELPEFGNGTTYGFHWGDFDHDGDADMAVVNGDAYGQNYYYLNEGDGNFTVFPEFGTAADNNWSGACGDFDNDGDLDFAVSGFSGTLSKLYENDGSANFTSSEPFESNSAILNTCVSWGDYDNDGDLDLAMGSSDTYQTRLYTNDGGSFTESILPSSTEYTTSLAWADYDRDGDLDLAVSDIYGQNYLYVNDQNDTGDDHYLSVHVIGDGDTTNVQGIGAFVKIYEPGQAGEPISFLYFREVSANNSCGQNYIDSFFGIPDYSEVDVVVGWPSAGKYFVSEYWANVSVGSEFVAAQGDGTPIGIDDEDIPNNPQGYYLAPAVPNPSTGAARISYALPKTCDVELSVFDVKGRKIATLVEGEHSPGEFSTSVNGLSSGIYLYRLTANEFSNVKKMVVR